jgi:hypothetical protein
MENDIRIRCSTNNSLNNRIIYLSETSDCGEYLSKDYGTFQIDCDGTLSQSYTDLFLHTFAENPHVHYEFETQR